MANIVMAGVLGGLMLMLSLWLSVDAPDSAGSGGGGSAGGSTGGSGGGRAAPDEQKPEGGALAGNRYRVLISSDIGGSDDDDRQSMVHYLVYSDLFDTEGLVSSPPHAGRARHFLEVIDHYEKDYPNLRTHSDRYPTPDHLRSLVKQGATDPAPRAGHSQPTEGSRWIIECARRDDARPLYVLVWGSITDVAQAVHDAPDIKSRIRIHFIASWNRRQCPHSAAYLAEHHPDLWLIYDDSTFRGMYIGGNQEGDLGNRQFVARHIAGHGALGDFMAPLKGGAIKMGDSPTVLRLLRGDPQDPTRDSWGGRFQRHPDRPNGFVDLRDEALREGPHHGARTVNQWREAYLRDWQQRMLRCASSRDEGAADP